MNSKKDKPRQIEVGKIPSYGIFYRISEAYKNAFHTCLIPKLYEPFRLKQPLLDIRKWKDKGYRVELHLSMRRIEFLQWQIDFLECQKQGVWEEVARWYQE